MNPEPSQQPPQENFWKDLIKFAITAGVIIISVRAFIAEPFIVSGASMDPTFASGQYLIVDELSYHFKTPARGDVVIFKYPKNQSVYFIKRIIGLPGETVSSQDGVISITDSNGSETKTLPETYLTADRKSLDSFTETLGSTEYFVMGDNRNQSSDSRAWGPLDRGLIVGRPVLRLMPPSIFPGEETETFGK
jgi:signal peptidase I